MKKLSKIILFVLGGVFAFFAVTFLVYFFNLDMKLTARLEPIFLKHYDRIERDTHL